MVLLVEYALDEGTGSAFTDEGALTTGTSAAWTTGHTGSALTYGEVNVNGVAIGNGDPWSVAFWMRPISGSACEIVRLGHPFAAADSVLRSQYSGGMAEFWGGSGASTSTRVGTAVPAGTWAHIAVTYSGTQLVLYRDGAVAQTLALSGLTDPVGRWWMGDNSPAGAVGVDDFRLYDHALSLAEVQAAMSTPVGGEATPPHESRDAPATLTIGGTATVGVRTTAAAPGALALSGTAGAAPRAATPAAGALILDAGADVMPRATAAAPAELALGGSAAVTPRAAVDAPVALSLSGSAAVAVHAAVDAPATLTLAGGASVMSASGSTASTTAAAALTLSGSAAVAVHTAVDAGATLTLTGGAAVAVSTSVAAPASLTVSGYALVGAGEAADVELVLAGPARGSPFAVTPRPAAAGVTLARGSALHIHPPRRQA